MNLILFSIIMIVLGFIYLMKPDIFKSGLWKQASILQNLLTDRQYDVFMRILGLIIITIGIMVLASQL